MTRFFFSFFSFHELLFFYSLFFHALLFTRFFLLCIHSRRFFFQLLFFPNPAVTGRRLGPVRYINYFSTEGPARRRVRRRHAAGASDAIRKRVRHEENVWLVGGGGGPWRERLNRPGVADGRANTGRPLAAEWNRTRENTTRRTGRQDAKIRRFETEHAFRIRIQGVYVRSNRKSGCADVRRK